MLEKTLETPLDCKEIKQSILKEISPEYSLEGLMLKQKLQYFGHLMRRSDSLEDFPGGSDGKASAYNAGDLGLISGLGKSPGEGNGYPLQYLAWIIR